MSNSIDIKTFEVEKANWLNTRVHTSSFNGDLNENEVLFEVDRFALTSNNISYAASGDMLGYWQFFPTTDDINEIGFKPEVRRKLMRDNAIRIYGLDIE